MKTRVLKFGNLKIGGDSPVLIQTMIKNSLDDVRKVLATISRLKNRGCDFIRLAFKYREDGRYLEEIIKRSPLEVEVDIHFHAYLAVIALNLGAKMVRVNPGNVKKMELREVVELAKEKKAIIRIGVNIGSLPKKYIKKDKAQGMVDIVEEYVGYLEKLGFYDIMLSAKSDSVIDTYRANIKLAEMFNYPIHLGVTATGSGAESLVKSSVGIGALLLKGIGDVIRVSYTGSVFKEIELAKAILQSLDIRKFGPEVISCPGCSRAGINLIKIANDVKRRVERLNINLPFKIAVMGCEVNGPGEAKSADIGIAGGRGWGVLFKKGKIVKKVKEGEMVDILIEELKTIAGGQK
ncbi:MAG: 4-hydroxy-3-methylbut-2-en-1-yl diphosphate synthase [Candidatus Omnitrophica bacterium 4484_49]|nr:MAG: 4-hydroxy-3-methylbut-2-en-1-yl diphosphate synthase [Candidatus Omnitrophica bacterium 4484_49]